MARPCLPGSPPGGGQIPSDEGWEALSGCFNGENHDKRKPGMTTPLIQTAQGETWRVWLPVSVAVSQVNLPVPDSKGIALNVRPGPRVLALQVEDPDDPAQLSAAIKALTERVAQRREKLPDPMSGRPMAGHVMVWRDRPGTRAEVAAFVL